jgi:uncharacterized Zn finger protein
MPKNSIHKGAIVLSKEKFVCPECGDEVEVVHDFDHNNLVAFNYPQCVNCGHTTHEVFQTEEAVKIFLRENGDNW